MGEHVYGCTGHRPDKLGGYSLRAYQRLYDVARAFLDRDKPDRAISGMALGWDQAFAEAAIDLGIPLIAAVPFESQPNRWPEKSQAHYRRLLSRCVSKEVICQGSYAAWKMQARNEWVVSHCTRLVAMWDGSDGGTSNCLTHAQKKGRDLVNLYDEWKGAKHGQ